jgi:hypothetical protein
VRRLVLFLVLLMSTPVVAQGLSPIKVSEESGFIDIEAPFIRAISIEGDRGVKGIAVEFGGTFKGKAVRYVLLVPRDWDDAPLQGLRLTPTPKASDLGLRAAKSGSTEFLEMLSTLYGLPAKSRRPKEFFGVEAFALRGVPEPVESGSLETKVFFNVNSPEQYAELYIHVDFIGRVVRLKEKDPEYRQAIVNALSE